MTRKVLVATRKVSDTWRDAVARRGEAFGARSPCLRAFDDYLSSGKTDFEAAFLTLRDHHCLWLIEGPEDPFSTRGPA